jgi:hypothetical protein
MKTKTAAKPKPRKRALSLVAVPLAAAAPRPWSLGERVRRGAREYAVLDLADNVVAVCNRATAELIVAAVNGFHGVTASDVLSKTLTPVGPDCCCLVCDGDAGGPFAADSECDGSCSCHATPAAGPENARGFSP